MPPGPCEAGAWQSKNFQMLFVLLPAKHPHFADLHTQNGRGGLWTLSPHEEAQTCTKDMLEFSRCCWLLWLTGLLQARQLPLRQPQ